MQRAAENHLENEIKDMIKNIELKRESPEMKESPKGSKTSKRSGRSNR